MEEIWYTLTGQIDAKGIGDAINWINGQLYQGSIKRLKFFISSTGGDMDSAIRLYDFLKALPIKVTTIGFGQVDSAAITIFLAGEERLAVKNCKFLLHEGTFTFGNATNALHVHEEILNVFKYLLERNVGIIAKEVNKPSSTIKKILLESKIMNTEDAKNFGLVNSIIEKFPPKQV